MNGSFFFRTILQKTRNLSPFMYLNRTENEFIIRVRIGAFLLITFLIEGLNCHVSVGGGCSGKRRRCIRLKMFLL